MLITAALVALGAGSAAHASATPARVEVVVTLDAPSLADSSQESRVLTVAAKARRLDLHSASSASYLRFLSARQTAVARRIEREIPGAKVRWRYQVVLDGLAVLLPRDRVSDLSRVAGVRSLYPDTQYRITLNKSPELIGADQLWGPTLSTAGQGVKIGIIDQGVDQNHPFFDPTGYAYPPGFPKGNTAFTTPKVIVARSFTPPGATPVETLPFADAGELDDHGTHVAGIAAGNNGIEAIPSIGALSGVAPKAYLGNYKALSLDVGNFALIENAAELIAAVDAAVKDGMDVINMSLGELELDPARSIVDAAVDGAAKAGVVPVVAAGNDFEDVGRGSVNTPGSAPLAISVAAATKTDVIAGFSSGGPTSLSHAMKPDVTAPGVSILSSVPPKAGTWVTLSGTSMATPHVAGGAALLRQRHPDWSVAQIKSALVLTGDPVYNDSSRAAEVPTTREGGGLIDLPKADNPLVFAQPTGLSFGLLQPRRAVTRTIQLTDAGGGGGPWTVSVSVQRTADGVSVTAPASISVPGTLQVKAAIAAGAEEADVTGFVVLTRASDTRRIPFWLRSEQPRLAKPTVTLRKQGVYKGDTRRGKARVSSYRYPDNPIGLGVSNTLPGPEQVFRVVVRGRVSNFGVVVTGQGRKVRVTPRIVAGDDENRLLGARALPVDLNPYLPSYGNLQPIAAAVTPAPGTYTVVFDTPTKTFAGPFTFRYWINDRSPPSARVLTPSVSSAGKLLVAVVDRGSGVDPSTISVTVDGTRVGAAFAAGRVSIPLGGLSRGPHKLVLQVSDYQEQKNSESVLGVLPNTRVLSTSFTVR